MKKIILLLIVCMSLGRIASGNGIVLSNLSSVPGAGFVQLQFDLTWNNSWNNSVNHDAAWVFFKFKDNDGTWHHLNLTSANNTIPAAYTLLIPPDLTGAIIHRSNPGLGTVTLTGVQLGVTNLPGNFDVKGFALEMVQIPVGDTYYAGDGENGTYYSTNTGAAFFINSNSISLGSGAGLLDDGIANLGVTVPLGSFPTGYNTLGAFLNMYMMKYEVSQAAYRDFLNTLTYTQQATRTGTTPGSAAGTMALLGSLTTRRASIKIASPGSAPGAPPSLGTPALYGCDLNNNLLFNESNDGEWIGCNYLTYMDLAAFLDWAALRPMSEMEFEKSCRGRNPAVAGENAAGVDSAYGNQCVPIGCATWTLANPGTANEAVSAYSGSVLYANITYLNTSPGGNSPTRVGIHATANATRISAGAGYYGALDLSGNIEEYTVTTANVAGRSFTGLNGDGTLTASGNADEDFWPGINGNTNTTLANAAYAGITGVTTMAGIITRGGSAGYTGANLNKVSYRIDPGNPTSYSRNNISGGRGLKNW